MVRRQRLRAPPGNEGLKVRLSPAVWCSPGAVEKCSTSTMTASRSPGLLGRVHSVGRALVQSRRNGSHTQGSSAGHTDPASTGPPAVAAVDARPHGVRKLSGRSSSLERRHSGLAAATGRCQTDGSTGPQTASGLPTDSGPEPLQGGLGGRTAMTTVPSRTVLAGGAAGAAGLFVNVVGQSMPSPSIRARCSMPRRSPRTSVCSSFRP